MKVVNGGENDEGDYDSWTITTILYAGKEFFKHRTDRSSNIGGAWGNDHEAAFAEGKTKLVITNIVIGGTVATGGAT